MAGCSDSMRSTILSASGSINCIASLRLSGALSAWRERAVLSMSTSLPLNALRMDVNKTASAIV